MPAGKKQGKRKLYNQEGEQAMEVHGLSTEALVLYAAFALAIVGYVTSKKDGRNRVGYDCNKRKEDEKHN